MSATFDSINNKIYANNYGAGTISIINGLTNSVMGNPLKVGTHPQQVLFDPDTGDVYVVNTASNNISVIAP